MSGGRVVALVFGCILAVLGLGVLVAGIVGAVAYGVARDDDGFFRTKTIHVQTDAAAVTSDSLDLGGSPGDIDWLTSRGDFATVSMEISSLGADNEVFAGIGPTAEVEAYLASVPVDRVIDYNDDRGVLDLARQQGSGTASPPGDQTFWAADVTTVEPAALEWETESGDWTVVLMNADGSAGIDADVRAGIKIDWLLPVAIGAMIGGFVFLAGGVVLIVFAARTPRSQRLAPVAPGTGGAVPPPPPPQTAGQPVQTTPAPTATPPPPVQATPPPATTPPPTTTPPATPPPTASPPPGEHPRPVEPEQPPRET